MKNLIKVLYISHEGDSMKGSTYSLFNMISAVNKWVVPIVILPKDGEACREFESRGIEYYIVPFKLSFTSKKGLGRVITFLPRYFRDYFYNYKAITEIAKIAQINGVNIIHSNSTVIDIGVKIAQRLSIKHVWHLREFLDKDFNFKPLIGWNLFLKKIQQSNAIICITRSINEHYKLLKAKNAYIVHDAVIKGKPLKESGSEVKKYLLFCGHVTLEKGIEEALMAFSVISKKYPELELWVAGSVADSYFPHLISITEKLGITDTVKFLGFRKDVISLMSWARCLLMCSKNEAQGRVTIEAMSVNCPVVAFASGGTLEIITENRTGFLYTSTDELVEKLHFIIENRENLNEILDNAQRFAFEHFSEEKYSKDLIKIYHKLLGKE